MVDIAEIMLRQSVSNVILREFREKICPILKKSARVRSPRQTEYNFHDFSLVNNIN
jgi:hypothetical protein